MMFLLRNIRAPPTIGSLAAMAPPATAKAITALALINLIFIVGTPFSVRPRASAGPYQCGGHLRYVPNCRSDAVSCIHLRVGWVICFEPICEAPCGSPRVHMMENQTAAL